MRDHRAQGACGMSAFDAFLYRGDDDPHTRALFAVACVLDRNPGRQAFVDTFDRASRLVPRLRQRVVAPRVPLFLPWWVVDPEFDLGFHLRFGRLPAPGSTRELLDAAQAEVTAPLDADRPLWEAVLLEGLEEGRAAIIVRLSHALTDSVGPSELLAAVLDSQRWPDKGPMPPAPSPQAVTPEELLSRSLGDFPAEAVDATRHLIAAVGNPQNLRSVLAGAVDFTESLGRVLASVGPPSPLLAGRSLRRRCAAFEVGMQDLKRSGNAVDASIGDVYLGCITEALRLYHDALHDPVENLPLAIPVGLRGPGGGASGNRFGALLIAAPLVAKNAAKRVALISRVVREGRAESAIDAVTVAAPLLARLPASMLRALAGLTPRPDILASSFPGLSKPRYIAGAKVLKSYTFGPVPGVAAMFTMQSIAGGCFISVNYDPAAIRYSDLFAKCLTRGFRTTLRLGGQRPQVGPVAVARMRDQEMAA